MPRWPKDEPVVSPDIVLPEDKPKEEIKEQAIPTKPEPQNSGEYWRSLTDEQKKTYLGLYSNPYVRVAYPDVVELAWSEYVKIPKGEQK